jgi:dihydropyrimidine dehydrogenase (NAD+) subunit PreA
MTHHNKGYEHHQAVIEAQRCLMCEDSPCNKGCPAGIDVKTFVRMIRFDNTAGAARKIKNANILGGVCAYICPSEELCAKECSNTKLTRPIDIAGLQRFAMDLERRHPHARPALPRPNGKKAAVVGAGPAGLACAAGLAVRGYAVTVFDANKEAGGVLRYGIPSQRLPEDVLNYEIGFIKDKLGVKFELKHKADDAALLLSKGFDAVFVSHGLGKARRLDIPGEDLAGVMDAPDFLARAKAGDKMRIGPRVLVIGGGSVAMDAVIEARRLGAERVFAVCLEDYNEMPAMPGDREEAWRAGVEYMYRVMPLAIEGGDKVTGFRGVNIRWKKPGLYVPSNAERVDGTEVELKVDTVIVAIGQAPNDPLGLAPGPRGLLEVNKDTLMTSKKGVFAGGDTVRGPALAVQAVADGKKAAEEIDKYLCHSEPRNDNARGFYPAPKADLSIDFCGVRFENPFILSAAPPTDDLEMVRNAFKAGWAGAVLKTTSVETEKVDLTYPMMSSLDYDGRKIVGLGNIDLISEHHIDEIEKRVASLKREFPNKVVIASMMGSKREEWQSLAGRLKKAGVDMIECSFSCPQGTLGSEPGAMLAQDVKLTQMVASWVKEAAGDLPVVIKITPQAADIVAVAKAVKAAGCDGVCASNTIPSLMGIDMETWVPNPNVGGRSTYSGLAGPAIKPITLRCIAEITRNARIPVTGTGGPLSWRDAAEFMLAGARTVQFCTAVMHYGYGIIDDLTDGLAGYLEKRGLKTASELVGRALPHIVNHDELPRQKKMRSNINKEKCIRDDLCCIACRDGGHMAIKLDAERMPTVDEEKCVGCGLCSLVCPVEGCIELKKK